MIDIIAVKKTHVSFFILYFETNKLLKGVSVLLLHTVIRLTFLNNDVWNKLRLYTTRQIITVKHFLNRLYNKKAINVDSW